MYSGNRQGCLTAITIYTSLYLYVLPRGMLRNVRAGDANYTPSQDGRGRCRKCQREPYEKLRHMPALLQNTLTYDRGGEKTKHE